MTFRNNLYFIDNISRGEDGVLYQIHLNAGHIIYQAHFPGEPITPGVCLLQMGVELLSDAVGCELELDTIKNVKFKNVLHPEGQTVEVHIHHWVQNEDTFKAQIEFATGEQPVAKMSLTCRKTVK